MRPLIYPLLFALIGVVADRVYLVSQSDPNDLSILVDELNRFMPEDEGQIVTLWLERDENNVLELKWDKSPRGYHSKTYRIHGAQAVEIVKD